MIKVLKKEFKTELKTLKLNFRPPFVVFLSGEMYSERTAVVKTLMAALNAFRLLRYFLVKRTL